MKGRCEAEQQPGYFTQQQPVMWPHSLIKLSLDIIIYPATAASGGSFEIQSINKSKWQKQEVKLIHSRLPINGIWNWKFEMGSEKWEFEIQIWIESRSPLGALCYIIMRHWVFLDLLENPATDFGRYFFGGVIFFLFKIDVEMRIPFGF